MGVVQKYCEDLLPSQGGVKRLLVQAKSPNSLQVLVRTQLQPQCNRKGMSFLTVNCANKSQVETPHSPNIQTKKRKKVIHVVKVAAGKCISMRLMWWQSLLS